MAARTYTVKKNDCLWTIAANQLGDPYKWTVIADLNDISKSNPIIYPNQVLKLTDDSGSTPPAPSVTENLSSKPTIEYFGLQAGTDRTVFAAWKWDKSNTKEYSVLWEYDTGNGLWFKGDNSTTTDKQSVYNAPTNAKKVRFKVKAVSTTRKVNNVDTVYWTAQWSTQKSYDFSNNPPSVPPVPTVTIEQYTLTAEVDNLDVNGTTIQFQIVKDNKTVFQTGTSSISTNHAAFSCTVDAGSSYKVRCRAARGNIYGDWSEYSENVDTIPSAPTEVTKCRANSSTSVYLEWPAVQNAKSYEVEYTTKIEYFDGSDATSSVTGIETNHYEKTGLETGHEYFFRVRAVNDSGNSPWSPIASTVVGKPPDAPTTWSSTTTAITGEPLTLYWVHNAEDGSRQTYAEVEITIGDKTNTYTIRPPENPDEDEPIDITHSYPIDTSQYLEGTKILWRVRTAGVTKTYGDWSVQRTVDVYAPPTLELKMADADGNAIESLTAFPFYVSALAGPKTQAPISYTLTVVAKESYQTVDEIGNFKMVNAGDAVYNKFFDISQALLVEISAGNIDLENNIDYTLICMVTMNSGLTAEASVDFTVSWKDDMYEPNAEIAYDGDLYVTYIRPYCEDLDGELIPDILLSVYRRQFDGSYVELATGLENSKSAFITDPHPALDYARYRIVAITKTTGAVSYYDVPGYPINEPAIIIQWDEAWSTFDVTTDDELAQPPWTGSLLRLPYNIKVSESNDPDVSLVEYFGRKYPVSYYGTQIGSSATWDVEIPRSDKETLYALRRLSAWLGDVYVREPTGSGYWANMTVSINQSYDNLVIPVSMSIKRVEGGA